MKTRPAYPLTLLFCLVLANTATALSLFGNNSAEALLDPAQAFRTSAMMDDNRNLLVRIDIADGYYVYRNKIGIASANARFGTPDLPDGIRKTDEFFGEVETYRGQVDFNSALESRDISGPLTLTVTSQGCADVGICYPPFSQQLIVEVPANSPATSLAISSANSVANSVANELPAPTMATVGESFLNTLINNPAPAAASSNILDSSNNSSISLISLGGSDESEILDPEVAFTVTAGDLKGGVLPVTWQIVDGHYLYRDKFKFEVVAPAASSVADITLSKGKLKNDEFFGEVEVHRGQAHAQLAIQNSNPSDKLTLKVGYQGCADIGICYPPQTKELQIAIVPAAATLDSSGPNNTVLAQSDNTTGLVKTSVNTGVNATLNSSAPVVAEQDRLAASLGGDNRWLTILTFFGMGLLLTFTPCVLPMIPILSSIIVGSGEKIGTGRAFILSLIYVLAMAATYTVAGVIVGLTGENIQATLQHPFVLTTFAILFVFLAASMFGLFELQMPAFIQNRLTATSNKQKSGSFSGVATMGFLSALIVGPCVTAPLVGALIYIGQTGDAVLGGAALFALSMGMGIPLLIIGTSFGKYLPTAGPWMDAIKAVFGVMLLGVAIWMLDRVIPVWATMLLSALLLIVVGMFMGAFENTAADARGWRRVLKGFGYSAVVYGTLLIIGIATGSGSLLRPLNGLSVAGHSVESTQHVAFTPVKGLSNLESVLASAQAQNKPVILDFYADWCVSCKEMEAFTFTDPQVIERMNKAVLLQADVTANDDADKALLKKFGIFGPPAIMFYDEKGVEHSNARVVGFMPAKKFASHLDQVL